jgi:transcriptional regulator with XRE-family HTH domain
MLKALIVEAGDSQADFARGIGRTESFVSKLIRGEVGVSRETIDVILAYLSKRLGRTVTYEECFGSPLPATELVAPGSAA